MIAVTKSRDWSAFVQTDWATFAKHVDARLGLWGSVWNRSSMREDMDKYLASHTASLEETCHIMRNGWSEGTARIVAGVETLNAQAQDWGTAWSMDVAGAFPDVGAFLAGEVEHMHAPDVETDSAPVVSIWLTGATSWKTKAHDMETFGVALLSFVDALEKQGKQLEIVWYSVGQPSKPSRKGSSKRVPVNCAPCTFNVVLKHAGEHMDVDRLAFALAHPSMLRRAYFAAVEQLPEFAVLGDNYGFPRDYPTEHRDANSVYLPTLDPDVYDLSSPARCLESIKAHAGI